MNLKSLIFLFFVLFIAYSCSESRTDVQSSGQTKSLSILNSDPLKTDSVGPDQLNINYGLSHFSRQISIKDWPKKLILKYKVKSIKVFKSIANDSVVSFADTVSYTYFNRSGFQVKDSLKNISVKYFNYENDKLTINEVKGDFLIKFIYSPNNRLLEEYFYDKQTLKSRTVYEYKDTVLAEINTFNHNNIKTDSIIYEFKAGENGWSKKEQIYEDEIYNTYEYDSSGRLVNRCGYYDNVMWCSSHSYDTLKNGQIVETIEIGGNGGRYSEPTIKLYNSTGQILQSRNNENEREENYTYDNQGRLIEYSEGSLNDKSSYKEIHSYDNYTGFKKAIIISSVPHSVVTTLIFSYEFY